MMVYDGKLEGMVRLSDRGRTTFVGKLKNIRMNETETGTLAALVVASCGDRYMFPMPAHEKFSQKTAWTANRPIDDPSLIAVKPRLRMDTEFTIVSYSLLCFHSRMCTPG